MRIIRGAAFSDINQILALIDVFVRQGLLLSKTSYQLSQEINDFLVCEDDDKVIACVALKKFSESLAEIRTLAVNPDFQGLGIGRDLVLNLIKTSPDSSIKNIFVLTYEEMFFAKLGFLKIDRNSLPEKIWTDCVYCSKHDDCDEIAMILSL
ncbi:hypothetical protein AB834_02155 [PVC group bacterium (ex Bugula neritina AB1)]|nr:hypothetical protein AB834_02155 [PVC group bacterium (ex Bugula neritina AB1)]